jgi:hypothetical protein
MIEVAPDLWDLGAMAVDYGAVARYSGGEIPCFALPLTEMLVRWLGAENVEPNHALDPQGVMLALTPNYGWHTDHMPPTATHLVTCAHTGKLCPVRCGSEFEVPHNEFGHRAMHVPLTFAGGQFRIYLAPKTMRHRSPHCFSHKRVVLRYYVRIKSGGIGGRSNG